MSDVISPQVCYFCGKDILYRGIGGECLTIHSVDGNHENYAEDNKVPTHKGCHIKYHRSKDSVKVTSRYTSVVVPVSIRDKLADLKKHRREPLWEVIERLLGGEVNE